MCVSECVCVCVGVRVCVCGVVVCVWLCVRVWVAAGGRRGAQHGEDGTGDGAAVYVGVA